MPSGSRRRARWRRPLALGVGVAVVLVAAGSGVAWAISSRGGDRYTTAVATMGEVQQTVAETGTVASALRRDVAFPVAGTVASVAVGLGDSVKAGQTLATMDKASLQDALDNANTTLQQAQQQLSDDLASQTATSTASSSSSSSAAKSSAQKSSAQKSSTSKSSSSKSSSSATGTQQPGSPASGSGTSSAGDIAAAVAAASQHVADAQQTLLAAYADARAALAASTQALADARTACSGATAATPAPAPADAGAPTPTDTQSASSADAQTASSAGGGTSSAGTPTVAQEQALITTCLDHLSQASAAQADTAAKQQAVDEAATALDQAVAALQQAAGATGAGSSPAGSAASPSGTGASPSGSAASPSTGTAPAGTGPTAQQGANTSTGTSSSSSSASSSSASSSTGTSSFSSASDVSSQTGTMSSQTRLGSSATGSSSLGASTGTGQQGAVATAADILSDQAAIDAAQAQVDIATRDLTLVNLTSPIAGIVGAVSITAGQSVSAQSSSAVITVLGATGYVVNLTVPLSSLGKLAVGQTAAVTVPSVAQALPGKVSSIGVLDVSSSSTPEYDVAVALDPTTDRLFDGSSAQVSIAVASTGQVLTVPTSAVHVSGQTATVQVLADGQVHDVTVKTGAVGADLTQITSGLQQGQTVVLADRSQPLNTGMSTNNSTNSGLSGLTNSRTTTGLGGGGGGAVFAPGGGTFSGRG